MFLPSPVVCPDWGQVFLGGVHDRILEDCVRLIYCNLECHWEGRFVLIPWQGTQPHPRHTIRRPPSASAIHVQKTWSVLWSFPHTNVPWAVAGTLCSPEPSIDKGWNSGRESPISHDREGLPQFISWTGPFAGPPDPVSSPRRPEESVEELVGWHLCPVERTDDLEVLGGNALPLLG